jgi:hypothetical protein
MNKESSRSHCILTMKVQCYELEDPSNCIESKLEIVDLAGSERQKVTKATGIVFREGIEINKSLFSLRQVIAALYESNTGNKSSNIPPYRDSKLTSLLKQSIGGNAYCAMVPLFSHLDRMHKPHPDPLRGVAANTHLRLNGYIHQQLPGQKHRPKNKGK